MATGLNGNFTISGTKHTKMRVDWSENYSISDNSSEISVNLYFQAVSPYGYYGYTYYPSGQLAVDGKTMKTFSSGSSDNAFRVEAQNVWYKIPGGPFTATVQHDTEGRASPTISIDITGYTTGGGPESGWRCTASKSVALSDIPRSSSIRATDAPVGGVSSIYISRNVTEYVNSVQYSFGLLSGYITKDGSVSRTEQKFAAENIGFSVPASWYDQIKDARSAPCTLTCRTYNGSVLVGQPSETSFSVFASQDASSPDVFGTVQDTNDATLAVTGNPNVIVRYASTAYCEINATAKNGASIVALYINGFKLDAGYTSSTIRNAETGDFVFMAQDSRGFSGYTSVSKQLIPYVPVTNNSVAKRTAPANNEVELKFQGIFYSGNFGKADNKVFCRYRVDNGNWVSVSPVIDGSTYYITTYIQDVSYASSHTIETEVSDLLSVDTASIRIGRGIPLCNWDGDFFNFNVPVKMNSKDIDVVVESGKAGIWSYRRWQSGRYECWGSKSVSGRINSAAGPLFSGCDMPRQNYPIKFAVPPAEVCTAHCAGQWIMQMIGGVNTESQTAEYSAVRTSAYSQPVTVYYDIYASGQLP